MTVRTDLHFLHGTYVVRFHTPCPVAHAKKRCYPHVGRGLHVAQPNRLPASTRAARWIGFPRMRQHIDPNRFQFVVLCAVWLTGANLIHPGLGF